MKLCLVDDKGNVHDVINNIESSDTNTLEVYFTDDEETSYSQWDIAHDVCIMIKQINDKKKKT